MMNPFELRFSIFNTAKDLLVKQYEANMATWDLLNKTTKEIEELSPKFPTIHEIAEKAIEINKFVSESNEREVLKAVKRASGVSVIF